MLLLHLNFTVSIPFHDVYKIFTTSQSRCFPRSPPPSSPPIPLFHRMPRCCLFISDLWSRKTFSPGTVTPNRLTRIGHFSPVKKMEQQWMEETVTRAIPHPYHRNNWITGVPIWTIFYRDKKGGIWKRFRRKNSAPSFETKHFTFFFDSSYLILEVNCRTKYWHTVRVLKKKEAMFRFDFHWYSTRMEVCVCVCVPVPLKKNDKRSIQRHVRTHTYTQMREKELVWTAEVQGNYQGIIDS